MTHWRHPKPGHRDTPCPPCIPTTYRRPHILPWSWSNLGEEDRPPFGHLVGRAGRRDKRREESTEVLRERRHRLKENGSTQSVGEMGHLRMQVYIGESCRPGTLALLHESIQLPYRPPMITHRQLTPCHSSPACLSPFPTSADPQLLLPLPSLFHRIPYPSCQTTQSRVGRARGRWR